MLRLTSQRYSELRSRFICTSCRALLASGATTQPGAVAKLCAARHYSTTPANQVKSRVRTEDKLRKTDKVSREKPDKHERSKPAEKEEKSAEESRKPRRRLGSSKASSSSSSSASRLQLWQETLKVLKEIQSSKDSPPPKPKQDAPKSGKPPASRRPEPTKVAKPTKAEGSPFEERLLDGALTVLKKVLREELRTNKPPAEAATSNKPNHGVTAQPEPEPGKKRPAAVPKTEAAAPPKRTKTLAEALGFLKATPAVKQTAVVEPAAVEISSETPADEVVVEEPVTEPSKKPVKGTVEKEMEIIEKPKPTPKATKPKSAPQPSKLLTGLQPSARRKGRHEFTVNSIDADKINLTPIEKPQPPVPTLAYGLDRVLFNPGVYHIQDPRSRVFNFDPYLTRIMPINEFDFNAIKQYVTSSKDTTLIQTAAEHSKKYTGSTSSMTSSLAHFHYLLSAWRPINPAMMSKKFEVDSYRFTRIMRAPAATFLHWKDGTYAIDADKEFDTANILSMLGKSMEKFLTLPKEEFEKYRKTKSDQLTDEERNGPESYHYTTLGDFMMRSQLDAYDPRLPGTGMFDLKTRAVISIRMDARGFEKGLGYEIRNRFGQWESFEREYYDMIRSAFLKYSLQVRMGRMDGIFVAFHNTERIFGFQYIPLEEMDLALHGQRHKTLGTREFKLSLHLLNKVLDKVTAKYPGRTLRLHFETRGETTPFMYIFAKPVTPAEVEKIQGANQAKVEEFERQMMGIVHEERMGLEDEEEEEDGAEEAVDEADEHDDLDESAEGVEGVEGVEGEEVTGSDAWEDVMNKVEDELEDEEHGVTFVREAIEDALQESGLLRTTAPDETQRYVDAFLEALTGSGSRAAAEDQAEEEIAEEEVAESEQEAAELDEAAVSEAVAESSETELSAETESSLETSEAAEESDATPSVAPEATEEAEETSEETSEEAQDEAESPATEDAPAEEPTLKDLIVKLATRIRNMPSERRTPSGEDAEVIDEDAPEYSQGLRKIERILSELTETEQPQDGDKVKEGEGEGATESDGNGVIETGTYTPGSEEREQFESGTPAESTETAESSESATESSESAESTETTEFTEPAESTEPATPAEATEAAEVTGTTESTETTPSPDAAPAAAGFSTKGFIDQDDEDKELYGLILTVRNKVDGEYVERPQKLKPYQTWTVEYAIEEIKPERVHTLYQMVLRRRQTLLYGDEKAAEDNNKTEDKNNTKPADGSGSNSTSTSTSTSSSGGGGSSERWYQMFQGRLKKYSTAGRKFRRRENRLMRDLPVHVYGDEKPYTYDSIFESIHEDGTRPYQHWPGESVKGDVEGVEEKEEAEQGKEGNEKEEKEEGKEKEKDKEGKEKDEKKDEDKE